MNDRRYYEFDGDRSALDDAVPTIYDQVGGTRDSNIEIEQLARTGMLDPETDAAIGSKVVRIVRGQKVSFT